MRYHGKQVVNQTRFVLEAKLRREAAQVNAAAAVASASTLSGGESDLVEVAESFEQGTETDKKKATVEAERRARLLVSGSQTAERSLEYLIDALLWVQGLKPKYGAIIIGEDLERLDAVREATRFGSAKETRVFTSTDNPDFPKQLRLHACEYLAPLIADMQIEWPSEMLKAGMEIVDLPGIGVHNDLYESVTADFLRNHAKALMLVTDSGGLRRDDAELLQASGFLNRLLHASGDPSADPVSLIVAVVKIDDVAVANHENAEAIYGEAPHTEAEYFAQVVASCRNSVKQQLEQFLPEVWASQDEKLREEKQTIIQRLLEGLRVFPVSAPEYRKILRSDPKKPSFLTTVEETQVPALSAALVGVSQDYRREKEARLAAAADGFFGQLRARLTLLSAQLSEESRAQHEREEMEQQLSTYLGPRQREFDTRRGEFRGYLRKTVPELIEAKVNGAATVAQGEINAYLRKLRDAHWGTLRAAVRRSGTFIGARHIQLPHDFSLCFEAPVAQVWSSAILQGIRKETANYSAYQEEVLKEVLAWAKTSGIKVTTKLLEALVEEVRQQRQRLNSVGKEAVEELRNKVRAELVRKIEGPIRRRCERFVEEGKDIGAGVKNRILEMFSELALEVVQSATAPAVTLLTERFKEVEREIVTAFKEHSNPLDEAADALLQRYDRQLARQNAHDTAALPVITAALEAIPAELAPVEQKEVEAA
ncbi:MAG: hypothetical protein BWX86_00046 [Verrucomicrobia bacterium ADurb.Bin122]|nr:MAG: hypothetical protein BWX86_00046 [Verrucomicrobia bacterium ADurb.Bin122]